MNKFVIGIISYFPNEEDIRTERQTFCFNLINKCKKMFKDIPIIVIAQNWQKQRIDGIELYEYEKLGIYQARNKLKDIFLTSEYDYLIMLDDDAILTGNEEDGRLYLEEALLNPNKVGYFQGKFLKLCCMPKEVYRNIPDFTNEEYCDEKFVYEYAEKHGMYKFRSCKGINHFALLNHRAKSTRLSENTKRKNRKKLLEAFDKWEKAVLRGREEDSFEIMSWYYSLLNLEDEAFSAVPARVQYYFEK